MQRCRIAASELISPAQHRCDTTTDIVAVFLRTQIPSHNRQLVPDGKDDVEHEVIKRVRVQLI